MWQEMQMLLFVVKGIIRKNYTTPDNDYFTVEERFVKCIVEIEISNNEEKQKQREFVFKI